MVRFTALALVLFVGVVSADDEDKSKIPPFVGADAGKLPTGWTATKTGKGDGSVWKVTEDATAPSKTGFVLSQLSAKTDVFNVCVCDTVTRKDVEVSVAFKANKGEGDQGGGVVWRYQDADNYYVARFNPLESNYRLYRVVGGQRKQLATKEELRVKAGEWHTLTVKMTGDAIACSLDGKQHLEAKDDTFAKAGKVGVWTKADAQTSFDQFRAADLGK